MTFIKFAAALALLLPLNACGPTDEDPGVGGVTVGEARALNEAAAMLDKARPADVVAPSSAPLPPDPAK